MASADFQNRMSMFIGMGRNGIIEMMSSFTGRTDKFIDTQSLSIMNESFDRGQKEGFISFYLGGRKYFGVYKYNPNWERFLVRAEEFSEFNEKSSRIF